MGSTLSCLSSKTIEIEEENEKVQKASSSPSPSNSDRNLIRFWNNQGNDLLLESLEYLDVVLIKKKPVNKEWRKLCQKAIDSKLHGRNKSFKSNKELRYAVDAYKRATYLDAEKIASRYGYPIDRWDISMVPPEHCNCVFTHHVNQKKSIKIVLLV